MEKKMDKKKQKILAVLGVLGIVAITAGISYAFFSYGKTGTKENTISSGSINFHYAEGNRSIALTGAMPMTDAQGKGQTDNYFDFTITGKTGKSASVPYTVTARVTSTGANALDPKLVKVYLSDQSDVQIEPVKYFDATNASGRTDVLQAFTSATMNPSNKYNERILYTGTVPADSSNYNKDFRLRIWVADDADFSPVVTPASCSVAVTGDLTQQSCTDAGGTYTAETTTYPNNDKTFSIIVNVYANGESVQEVLTYNASQVSYTNAAAPSVATVADALDDLTTRLGN